MNKRIINNRTPLAIGIAINLKDAALAAEIREVIEDFINQSPLLYVAQTDQVADATFIAQDEKGLLKEKGFFTMGLCDNMELRDTAGMSYVIEEGGSAMVRRHKLSRLIFDYFTYQKRYVIGLASKKWLNQHLVHPDETGFTLTVRNDVDSSSPAFMYAQDLEKHYKTIAVDELRPPQKSIQIMVCITISLFQNTVLSIDATYTLPSNMYFLVDHAPPFIDYDYGQIEDFRLQNSYTEDLGCFDTESTNMQKLFEVYSLSVGDDISGMLSPWRPTCAIVKCDKNKSLPLFRLPKNGTSIKLKEIVEGNDK